jgi:hypothetical protein
VVVDQELKLQEREQRDDLQLEALVTCESELNTHEATLVAGQKELEEAHAGVLAHELTANIRDGCLNSREE